MLQNHQNAKDNKFARFITTTKIGLVTLDTLSISAAWLLAYYIRQHMSPMFGYPLNPLHNYLKALPVIVISWLIANSLYGLYNKIKRVNYIFIMQAVFKSTLLGSLVTMSVGYWLREFSIGRSSTLIFLILTFIFLLFSRTSYVMVNEKLMKKGYGLLNTIIIGAGETGIRALQKISEYPEYGYNVIGFLDDDNNKTNTVICNIPVIGTLQDLPSILDTYHLDKVIFAIPSLSKDKIFQMISDSGNHKLMYMIVSNVFPVMSENMFFEDIGGIPSFILKSHRERKFYDTVKRAFDVLFSLIFLIISLPFIPFIALLIKLDSKGTLFFKQKRIGRKNKPFIIYKFRTMYTDASLYEKSPRNTDDPRITRIGRILRRFSLDELPQFYNVLIGEMSIIGPRPEMPFIVEQYREWQRKRLEVRPGITGLWQILGRKELPLEENLEYDFYYITNRSFSLDIAILIKTIFQVMKQKGAY